MSRSCYPSLVVASCLLAVAAAADPLGVKLNGPIPPGQSVSTFRLSPDGSRAVFEVGASEQSAIFSVPTAGGAPTPLHPPLDGGLASSAGISPDGTWVVFKARFSPSGPLDTYAVPIEGGPLTLLGGDPGFTHRISADSSRLLFLDGEGIKSVPITGGPETVLSAPLAPGQFLTNFAEQPDGSLLYAAVVCEFECEFVVPKELFVVPAAGGPALSLAALSGEGRAFGFFAATPDGSRVVYEVNESWVQGRELYSLPSDGGPATRLNPPVFAPHGQIGQVAISPDGGRVVYFAEQDRTSRDLYSVPVAGGAVTRLNQSVFGVSSDVSRWEFSPGWSRIVYLADFAFRSVPIAGGPSTQVGGTLLGAASTSLQAISPNDRWVLYRGELSAGVAEIFAAPVLGGSAVRLNAPLPSGGDVSFAGFTSDSTRVVYSADQETDGVQELWSVPVLGGAPTKLNAPLVSGGDVAEAFLTSDGLRVVYVADQDQDGVRELYVSPLPPPPPSTPPRRCGLLGAEAVGLLAVFEALRARRLRRARGRSAQPRSAA